MAGKLMNLEEWAASVYGDSAPATVTLRRWAREARIYPAPEKHGRSYFVQADARYIDTSKPQPTAPAQSPQAGGRRLIDRIPNGTQA